MRCKRFQGKNACHKPKDHVMDEPLVHLDVPTRRMLRLELRRILINRGVPSIYVTHYQDDVYALADYVAILQDGKVVYTDRIESILSNQSESRYPFISSMLDKANYFSFDYRYMESKEWCKGEISKQIEAIEKDPSNVVSPITHALNLLALKTSDEPSKAVLQQMQSDLQIMKTKIANLESRPFYPVLVK
ncbi:MAG: hypothetical protein ACRD8Z_28425, partial [Nitrososphaeraceae archaeon]